MNIIRRKFWDYISNRAEKLGVVPAEKPENEKARLQDLSNLNLVERKLDIDQRFSSLPRLAAYLTICPQASINIIDENIQHCKVDFGKKSSLVYITKEIPRGLTTCQFVLNNNLEPLVIEDCSVDERTKSIFELGGGVAPKFYAGSPIISKNGYVLGSFCVMDEEPRSISHAQLDGLRILSDQFVELLETPSSATDVRSNDEKMEVCGEYHSLATILFADFVGFTKKTEALQPGELLEILSSYFNGFDQIMDRFGLKKVKTIGDAYMAIGGVPDKNSNHAYDICLAAMEMMNYVKGVGVQQQALGNEAWDMRIGINTGPIISGNTGDNFDIWGDAVNIAARLESSSEVGRIQISEKTKQFLPDDVRVTFREKVHLKNKGEMDTFFLDEIA